MVTWNIRTLQDNDRQLHRKTAILAQELARYNVDVAALSETRFADLGTLVENGVATPSSGGITQNRNLDCTV